MNLTRTGRRALAGACALTLLLAACSDDDEPTAETVDEGTEQTTTTAADEEVVDGADDETTTTTADDETTTTEAEAPADSGDGSGDGTEGDPDAVALAQRINLTIGDFADGWTETPAEDDDGGANLDDCFVETDIEAVTGLSEGNIFQGELALSQLFFLRPAPAWADHRTPIRGYYQCGSGTHPGGGIMGASGRLAARAVLTDGRAS